MFNGDYAKLVGVGQPRVNFFPMDSDEGGERGQIEEEFLFNSPNAVDVAEDMLRRNPGEIQGDDIETAETVERAGTKRAEKSGLVGKDSVTLNAEQSVAILKEAGYNADNCFKNTAADGTVSFQFGNEHVRVVEDSKTGKITLLKTHIERSKEGEESKSVTTKFVMKKTKTKVDKYAPDENGKLNETQINSLAKEAINGKKENFDKLDNSIKMEVLAKAKILQGDENPSALAAGQNDADKIENPNEIYKYDTNGNILHPGKIEGNNVKETAGQKVKFPSKAEDTGLIGQNSVTLNQKQSAAILKEAGYNADNCVIKTAEDGSISFQSGTAFAKVVINSDTNKINIVHTQMWGFGEAYTTVYEIDNPKTNINPYEPDKNGKLNQSQEELIIKEYNNGNMQPLLTLSSENQQHILTKIDVVNKADDYD